MEALQALRDRRSVRKYTAEQVPEAIIREVINAGRLAASARNGQPWEFVVIRDTQTRNSLAQTATFGKFLAQAPVNIVVLCHESEYWVEDGAAATQNILVAAKALGLGTCWIAGRNKEYAETIGQLVGAPKEFHVFSLIALGYPDEIPKKEKRALDDVIHWEKF